LHQFAAQLQHQILDHRVRALNPVGERQPILPIDAVQSLVLGPRQPILHGGQRHRKLTSNGPLRQTSAGSGYQGLPQLRSVLL
jgi:hypothetical protein